MVCTKWSINVFGSSAPCAVEALGTHYSCVIHIDPCYRPCGALRSKSQSNGVQALGFAGVQVHYKTSQSPFYSNNKRHGSSSAPQLSWISPDAMEMNILLASDSVVATLRHRSKRNRSASQAQRPPVKADNCAEFASSNDSVGTNAAWRRVRGHAIPLQKTSAALAWPPWKGRHLRPGCAEYAPRRSKGWAYGCTPKSTEQQSQQCTTGQKKSWMIRLPRQTCFSTFGSSTNSWTGRVLKIAGLAAKTSSCRQAL